MSPFDHLTTSEEALIITLAFTFKRLLKAKTTHTGQYQCVVLLWREMKRAPLRLYRCPLCGYGTEYRWLLKDHLMKKHSYRKQDAKETAAEHEYWLSPRYIRFGEADDESES